MELYIPINECQICNKPADILYLKTGALSTDIKFFCKDHGKQPIKTNKRWF